MVFIPRWERFKDKKPANQYEIDWGNFLSDGITGYYPEPDKPLNIVANNTANISQKIGRPYYDGEAGVFNSERVLFHVPIEESIATTMNNGLTHTVTVGVSYTSTANFNIWSEDRWDTNQTFVINSIGGVIQLRVRDVGWSYNFTLDSGQNCADGLFHIVSITYNPNGNIHKLYIDGKLKAQTSTASTALFIYGRYIGHGGRRDSTVMLQGRLHFTDTRRNTLLSNDEIAAYHEAPYQILKPRRKWYYFTDATGNIFNQSLSLSLLKSVSDNNNINTNKDISIGYTSSISSANISNIDLNINLGSIQRYESGQTANIISEVIITTKSGISTSYNVIGTPIDVSVALSNQFGIIPSINVNYNPVINLNYNNSIVSNTIINYNTNINLNLLARTTLSTGTIPLPIEVLMDLNSRFGIPVNTNINYNSVININTNLNSNISAIADYNLDIPISYNNNILNNIASVLDASLNIGHNTAITDLASLEYDFNISLRFNEYISILKKLIINQNILLNNNLQTNISTISNYNLDTYVGLKNQLLNNTIVDYNTSISLAINNILSSTSGKELIANIALIAQQGISTTQLITLEGSVNLGIVNNQSNETLTSLDVSIDVTTAFLEALGTSVNSLLDVNLDSSFEVNTNGRNPNLVIRTNKGKEILIKAENRNLKIQYIDNKIHIGNL